MASEPSPKKPRRHGRVFIAAMNMRGVHAPLPNGSLRLNVTSAQGKAAPDRLTFSPMTMKPYKGFPNFEAYWQHGKHFKEITHEKLERFWRTIDRPRRRYPGSKGLVCTHARFPGIDKDLQWVESRQRVYIPEYSTLIQHEPRLQYWIEQVQSGQDVTVYDFDGPRDAQGNPIVEEVSIDMLRRYLHSTCKPFGHGFIVASMIKGLMVHDWNPSD